MSEPNKELLEAGWRVEQRNPTIAHSELYFLYSNLQRGINTVVTEEQALKVEQRHRGQVVSEANRELIEAGWDVGWYWHVGKKGPDHLYCHKGRDIITPISEEEALKVEASGQPVRERIFAAINEERRRQGELWGDQWEPGNLGESEKLAILVEETGEVAQELQPGGTAAKLRKELVQAGAVIVAWLESLREWEEDHG